MASKRQELGASDSISVRYGDQVLTIPVVAALVGGQPAELTGDLQAEECDHRGASWSQSLALHCPRCGIRLFAPGGLLAYKSEAEVEELHRQWRLAGYPDVRGWLASR